MAATRPPASKDTGCLFDQRSKTNSFSMIHKQAGQGRLLLGGRAAGADNCHPRVLHALAQDVPNKGSGADAQRRRCSPNKRSASTIETYRCSQFLLLQPPPV